MGNLPGMFHTSFDLIHLMILWETILVRSVQMKMQQRSRELVSGEARAVVQVLESWGGAGRLLGLVNGEAGLEPSRVFLPALSLPSPQTFPHGI